VSPGGSAKYRRTHHPETQKWVKTLCVAWQPRMCRQAVPPHEPQNHVNEHVPPGGYKQPARRFLEISRIT